MVGVMVGSLVMSIQKKKSSKPKIVSFMPSCNWIMKKKNFLKFGYMDGNMLRNEDWDFVFNRMKKKKFKLLFLRCGS